MPAATGTMPPNSCFKRKAAEPSAASNEAESQQGIQRFVWHVLSGVAATAFGTFSVLLGWLQQQHPLPTVALQHLQMLQWAELCTL